jgi:hypothetical protein
MNKLLLVGPCWSSDWTIKYSGIGWPNMLSNDFVVTNLSQTGCSEYKIYLQLQSVDIHAFDAIIVTHSTPRVFYVKEHPVHYRDPLHKNSDLVYNDIREASKKDKSLLPIVTFFENYIDLDFMQFIFDTVCEKIDQTLQDFKGKVLHVAHFPDDINYTFPNLIKFDLFPKHRGLLNHYDDQGNSIVYKTLLEKLKETT